MKYHERFNPAVIFFYLTVCAVLPMFSMEPLLLSASLVFSVLFYSVSVKNKRRHFHLYAALIFVLITGINPLFSHNGKTVLFYLNNNPVTLEATLYGAAFATAVVSALYWFACLSELMSSDKIIYIFGSLSPKAALLISMTLKFIPAFRKKTVQTRNARRAAGMYTDAEAAQNVKGKLAVYSSVITWALETGIITADSMDARGYGTGRPTRFALYAFRKRDGALLSIFAVLFGLCIVCGLRTETVFTFYPSLSQGSFDGFSLVGRLSYLLMAALPAVSEWAEKIKWNILLSKI